MNKLALAVSMYCASAAAAQPTSEYRLVLDPSEMESGVADLTTIARLGFRGADELVPGGGAIRLAALVAVDTPLAIMGVALPHALFGHGARAREFGFAASYDLEPPPPYAWLFGGELRSGTDWDFGDRFPATLDETALFTLGGLEAQEVQLRALAFTAFRARRVARGDALLYAVASTEVISYFARGDGDVATYYENLHARYGADRHQQRRRTQLSAAFGVADPMFVFSLYQYFYRYLLRNESSTPYPTISLGATELSLTNRLLLVPWGREHELSTLVGTRFGNFATTIGVGEGPGGSSVSLTVDVADVPLARGLFAVGRLQAAYHPKLGVLDRDSLSVGVGVLGAPSAHVEMFGGEVGVDYRWGRWVLGARFGSKSAGYAAGKPYASTTTAGLSIAVQIATGS